MGKYIHYSHTATVDSAGQRVNVLSPIKEIEAFITIANKQYLPNNPKYETVNYVCITPESANNFTENDKIGAYTIKSILSVGRFTELLLEE